MYQEAGHQTISKIHNLIMDACRLASLKHFLVGRGNPRIADVIDDGVVKENGTLRNHPNSVAKTAPKSALFRHQWMTHTYEGQFRGHLGHQ